MISNYKSVPSETQQYNNNIQSPYHTIDPIHENQLKQIQLKKQFIQQKQVYQNFKQKFETFQYQKNSVKNNPPQKLGTLPQLELTKDYTLISPYKKQTQRSISLQHQQQQTNTINTQISQFNINDNNLDEDIQENISKVYLEQSSQQIKNSQISPLRERKNSIFMSPTQQKKQSKLRRMPTLTLDSMNQSADKAFGEIKKYQTANQTNFHKYQPKKTIRYSSTNNKNNQDKPLPTQQSVLIQQEEPPINFLGHTYKKKINNELSKYNSVQNQNDLLNHYSPKGDQKFWENFEQQKQFLTKKQNEKYNYQNRHLEQLYQKKQQKFDPYLQSLPDFMHQTKQIRSKTLIPQSENKEYLKVKQKLNKEEIKFLISREKQRQLNLSTQQKKKRNLIKQYKKYHDYEIQKTNQINSIDIWTEFSHQKHQDLQNKYKKYWQNKQDKEVITISYLKSLPKKEEIIQSMQEQKEETFDQMYSHIKNKSKFNNNPLQQQYQ